MPLQAQLSEFETGRYPRAILKDDSGNFIKNVDLSDRGDGLYTELEPMPSKNVIATYKVFSDAARTVVTDDEAGLDVFILDTFSPERRDDKIFGIIDFGGPMIGVIEEDSFDAVLDENVIEGNFEDSDDIIATIDDDEITGKVRCNQ